MFHDLRSHVAVDRDAAMETIGAGGGVDLPGAEVPVYEDSWVGALAGGDLEHVAGGVHGREEGGADAVRGGHSRDHHEAEPAAGGGTEVQELAIQSHLQQRTDQDAAEGGEEGGKDFVRVFVWNCDVWSLEKGNEENVENQGVIMVSVNLSKANASSQNESRIMPKQH